MSERAIKDALHPRIQPDPVMGRERMEKSKARPVPRREFDAAYRRHLGFVWRMLRYYGVPPEAMDDAVQDVFMVVHRRWHSWDRERAERAWLFSVVRRVASAQRRSASRHLRRVRAAPVPARPSSIEDRVASREELEAIEQILAGMNEVTRTTFVLSVIEGLSAPEIAEITHAKLNTVYGRLRTAKITVAEQLRQAQASRSET